MPVRSRHPQPEARDEFHGVRLTHPDRVIFKEQGITKLALAEYYVAVADRMLPRIVDRPLSLVRCPGGASSPCFFQKQPPEGLPDVVRRVKIRFKEGESVGLYVEDIEGILSLVQFGVLEFHAWQSRVPRIEKADQLVFDLDPAPDVAWAQVVRTAFVLRDLLSELKLVSFVKTTGGKGLHIVAPIAPKRDWDEVKLFCRNVANVLVQADPQRYTLSMSKAARPGKIFVDYLRNERGATAVAPFSTRARANAPISFPLSWQSLKKCPSGDAFTVSNALASLKKQRSDPWKDWTGLTQQLQNSAIKAVAKAGSVPVE